MSKLLDPIQNLAKHHHHQLYPHSTAVSLLSRVPLASILQRLPGVLQLLFIPFCLLAPIYAPFLFAAYFLFLHLSFAFNAARSMVTTRITYKKVKEHSTTDWADRYCREMGVQSIEDTRFDLPMGAVRHVIIIPQYREDLGTMWDTLDVLASHPLALTHYKICLAMEESEAGATEKAQSLIKQYHTRFYEITSTHHPSCRPGEIRGKGSNVAWAAKEMVREAGGPRIQDIITVMDADTCFAADYFIALSYHYAIGTPKQRALMFFAPPTLFDRVADMQWSMGVISGMYEGSPFTPPCSAYSIPMKLAAAVGLWDVDPSAIGEDFHMYLKCFFSTHGEVTIIPIYSPASCCNIEGRGFFGGMYARSIQAKRHLWGALDLGYTIRRALFGLFAPSYDAPNNVVIRIPMLTDHSRYDFHRLAARLIPFTYRVLECHIFVGQVLLMMIICKNFIPAEDSTNWLWEKLSGGSAVHPYVYLALHLGNWITNFAGAFFVFAVIFYEKYQYYCGVRRWELAFCEELHPGTGRNVQPLGIRSKLKANRSWFNIFEWFSIPIVGVMFMVVPQVHVHLSQLFTNSLTYVVAAKPQHEIKPAKESKAAVVSLNSPGVAGSSGRYDIRVPVKEERGDSGFYEFDGTGMPASDFHPGLWKTVKGSLPSSPSQDSVETLAN